MEVVRDPSACPRPERGTVVTIGAYDGVHLGHRDVIAQVRRMAAERGCASAVVTFDPHPAAVVRPSSAPLLLTDLETKLELLAETGIDTVLVVHFDHARAAQSATDFVRETLLGCLRARAVVVGHDFHFGHGREGNVPFLQHMGAEHGFDVLGLRLTAAAGQSVTSTRIRTLLAEGEVEAAAALLGRPHEVHGVVEHGDKRARSLGYRTANVGVPDGMALPADGVYAGEYVHPDGTVSLAAISLGRRPQFYEDRGERLLEPHLLDWDGDLYDQRARVRFLHHLRGQRTFADVDALVRQIGADVARTRELLSA